MEEKTTSIRRELLLQIITKYGSLEKKVLIKKVKDSGVYKNFISDEEVYDLVLKFAECHSLYVGYKEPISNVKAICNNDKYIEKISDDGEGELINLNEYEIKRNKSLLDALEKEHTILSKKILTLNKLIELYKIQQ